MSPLRVAAVSVISFAAGVAAILAGGYLWLDRNLG